MDIPFDITLPVSVPLRTKNLNCCYERGALRYIRRGNTELVRMIYCAVRDNNWGTVPYVIVDEKITDDKESFVVRVSVKYEQENILFFADLLIEGKDDMIYFSMRGSPGNNFLSNRTGLCVHLPVKEFSGIPTTITGTSGNKTDIFFPGYISPHQPFTDIGQLDGSTYGTDLQLVFSGEVFEAEDQRNWMDNSFKLYNRPLSRPFPFPVTTGESIQQHITLKTSSSGPTIIDQDKAIPGNEWQPIPALGIAAADEVKLLTGEEAGILKLYPFSFYRAELHLDTAWEDILDMHIANAGSLGARLQLVVFFTDRWQQEQPAFLEKIFLHAESIYSVLPLHKNYKVTPGFLQAGLYPVIKKNYPNVLVGYGTDIYFTELNRQKPAGDLYDFVSFSLNPQVHNDDALTVLENLRTLPDIIRTISSFTSKPVVVSPVTFKKRKNHDGAGDSVHNLVDNYDERQFTWYGAGWFLLSLYYLRHVSSAVFFTTTGRSGLANCYDAPLGIVLQKIKTFQPVSVQKIYTANHIRLVFRNKQQEEMDFVFDEQYSQVYG